MDKPDRKLISIEARTFAFAAALIKTFRENPPRDEADRVIWHQLLRSGTSAGANSAESAGAQSRRDWLTRRFIALKEMREAHFWLRLIKQSDTRRTSGLEPLLDEANQLVAILTAILKNASAHDRKSAE